MTQRELQFEDACPFPLLEASRDNTNFVDPQNLGLPAAFECGFRCTGTMVNDEDLEFYNTLLLSVSGVSFVSVFFVFLTWGMFKAKGRQKMTFWVSFCSLVVTSSVFLPALISQSSEKVWCKNELEGFTQADGISFCLIQAFVIVFFGLALCAWWFCSCFDIFSKLYRRKRNISHYLTYYHIFSWGLATSCTLILLSGGHLGYSQPRLWCFLNPSTPGTFEFVFYYGWVGMLWIFGTFLMILVIWSIFSQTQSYRKNAKLNNGDNDKQQRRKANYFKKLSLYRTPIVFVIVFSFFWAVFFTFVIVTERGEDAFITDAGEWIGCLFIGRLFASLESPHNTNFSVELPGLIFKSPEGGCGDIQPNGVSKALLTVAVITLSGNGILVVLIFGFQTENFKLWVNLFQRCCGGNKPKSTLHSGLTKNQLKLRTGKRQVGPVLHSTFTEKRLVVWNFFGSFFRYCSGASSGTTYVGDGLRLQPNKDSQYQQRTAMNDSSLRYQDVHGHDGQSGMASPPGLNPNTSPPQGAAFVDQQSGFQNQDYRNLPPHPGPPPNVGRNNRDPFPTEGPKRESYVKGRERQTMLDEDDPPPGIPRQTGDEVFSDWEENYVDPLWGVNVEF